MKKKHLFLFKNLADNNIAIAQYFVGNMLYAGEGVSRIKKLLHGLKKPQNKMNLEHNIFRMDAF